MPGIQSVLIKHELLMPGFLRKPSSGTPGCPALWLGGAGSRFHPADLRSLPQSVRRCNASSSFPARPCSQLPSSPRKLRRAGCPREVTQLGSLAESGLIGPRSPAPQLPGFRGPEVPRGPGRSKGHSWTPTCLGPGAWVTIIPWFGL